MRGDSSSRGAPPAHQPTIDRHPGRAIRRRPPGHPAPTAQGLSVPGSVPGSATIHQFRDLAGSSVGTKPRIPGAGSLHFGSTPQRRTSQFGQRLIGSRRLDAGALGHSPRRPRPAACTGIPQVPRAVAAPSVENSLQGGSVRKSSHLVMRTPIRVVKRSECNFFRVDACNLTQLTAFASMAYPIHARRFVHRAMEHAEQRPTLQALAP
jgi:hypothetical protein